MPLTHTYTRTHTVRMFADPYKVCCECGGWITEALEKSGPLVLVPCGHQSDYRDVCPSWSPVGGCRCVEHLGAREHGEPPR